VKHRYTSLKNTETCVADADVHVKKATEEADQVTVREESPVTETVAEDLKKNPEI
jgi:hypothetical protein